MRAAVASVLLAALLLPGVVAGQISLRRSGRQSMPTVEYDSHFVFTRIRYGASLSRFGGGGWEHDYPTAERNFAEILDYITNMRVRKDGSNILDLDDSRIFENPVIYMSEPGYWTSNDAEAKNLREYLLKGGLLIFDDFEGDGHWRNMVAQMNRALPNHHFIRLDVSHPVFQSFFNIKHLEVPHPTVNVPPSFWGMFDNNDPSGRMLALANWNNDLGDYWEWSAEGLYGTDPTNDAYRLGVNYIVYAMTH
jgi:Domain of unknown function (DUF4159)